MRNILLLLLLFHFPPTVLADNLLQRDEAKHFILSAGLGIASALVIREPDNFWKPFGLAMILPVAKEISDATRRGGSGWSNRDIAFDALGATAGVQLGNGALIRISRLGNTVSIVYSIPLHP